MTPADFFKLLKFLICKIFSLEKSFSSLDSSNQTKVIFLWHYPKVVTIKRFKAISSPGALSNTIRIWKQNNV